MSEDSTASSTEKTGKKRKSKKDIEIENLKKELEAVKAESEELKELVQRLQADFDNYRKRVQRENELREKYGCEKLIVRMLDVIDTLERAIAHEKGDFRTGLEMIKAQIESILSDFGVEAFDSVGKDFDPNLHEAIAAGEGEENTVVEEYQKGYRLYDKVIRHAKVKVGRR